MTSLAVHHASTHHRFELGPQPTIHPKYKLVTAAASGDLNQVQKLLKSGVAVNAIVVSGVVEVLTKSSHQERGYYESDAYIDPATQLSGKGCTALHAAAQYGHIKMIKALVAAGADLDALDERDETPLFRARNDSPITTLLEYGADVFPQRNKHAVIEGTKTYHYSCLLPIFHFYGPDSAFSKELHRHLPSAITAVVKQYLAVDNLINVQNPYNHWTILAHVIYYGNLEGVQTLLRLGASPHTIVARYKTLEFATLPAKHQITLIQLVTEVRCTALGLNSKDDDAIVEALRKASSKATHF